MPSEDFAARVRQERSRLGLSQEQAAELLGVSRGSYKQYEDGGREPRLSTLAKLVQAGFRLEILAPELEVNRES